MSNNTNKNEPSLWEKYKPLWITLIIMGGILLLYIISKTYTKHKEGYQPPPQCAKLQQAHYKELMNK
jgi:hypothetical protein